MALTWSELNSQLIAGARNKKEIISASFELTARCNLRCKMCYVSTHINDEQAKAKELTTDQWIHIAEEARDAGLLFLTLTGGEVFIRDDFKIIYERLMNLGFLIEIYTNGTMITPEIVDWLATMPPARVSITLYGSSRETYQKVTGNALGYDRTVRAIDLLIAKGIPTEIKTTVVQGNKHEFDQLLEFASQRKLGLGVVNYISPNREGCSDPLGNRLSPQELLKYEIHMTERNQYLLSQKKTSVSKINDVISGDIIPKTTNDRIKVDSTHAFKCMSGNCAAWVAWDGRLLPCGLLEIPEVNLLEKSFQEAWEEIKLKCEIIPVCAECQVCQYRYLCEHCPARLFRETGRYDQPAPYLCELAQIRTQQNNKRKI